MRFYRPQFWRLQKLNVDRVNGATGFIGHNFGDYKNRSGKGGKYLYVLSATILETTKTRWLWDKERHKFYRPQFWRLQKPQMVAVCKTPRRAHTLRSKV